MRSEAEMQDMAKAAQREAGWDAATMTRIPLSESAGLGGLSREFDDDHKREDRAYALGVEAGILWALGWAGNPFPR